MSAVVYRVRALLRSGWIAAAVLTVLIAVVAGAVMAIAAGAHRTATAPDRYTASVGGGPDAIVTQQDGGPPITDVVAGLSSVASAESVTFVFGGIIAPGSDEPLDAIVFAGLPEANGLHVVDGRPPTPGNSNEFVATRDVADADALRIGDTAQLIALTQAQANAGGFDASTVSIRRSAVLVGILDGPARFEDPTPIVVFGPTLLTDEPDIGVALTLMGVTLRSGSDLVGLRADLDSLPDGASLSVEPASVVKADLRRAVSTLAVGLWLVVLVAGLAALAVLGQLVTRQVRLGVAERGRLSAIGATDRQIVGESFVRAAVPIVVGSLLGGALSTIPSGVFPTGYFRRLEPDPGFAIDAPVILVGVVLTIVGIAGWVFASLQLAQRPVRARPTSALLERVVARIPGAAAATGVRFAFTRRAGDRASVRGPIVAVVSTVAGLVGAVVFGVSMGRLVAEPPRYGANYDIAVGDDGAETFDPELEQTLRSDPEVTSAVLYAQSHGRIGSADFSLLAMDVVRGDAAPAVLEGRLPAGDDEIAFGRVSARDAGVSVGEDVEVAGSTGTAAFTVVGLVVVPGFGANEGMGDGAVVAVDGLARIDSEASIASAAVSVADWRRSPTVAAVLASAGLDPAALDRLPPPFRPAVVVNVSRVRAVPFVLAGVLGALAVITVANVVLSAVRGRRRDLVVLRALGGDQRWITRTVHCQASAFVVSCLVMGVVIGGLVGAALFTWFAREMGAIDDAARPWTAVGVVAIASIVLANAAALLPSRQARRWIPADVLRTE